MTDYYQVLGVSRDAGPDEIKRAYRRLARELHPDVNPDPGTQEKFKDITAAYEVLRDPEKRRVYDRGGDPRGQGGAGFGQGFDFGDIMDAFFGGGGGGQARGPRPRTSRGSDALIRLDVTLEEIIHGANKEITVDTAVVCDQCRGEGTAPQTSPATCDMCKGRGEIQSVQRSFLGQVMTSRPCPACQGFGTVIPHPCAECAGGGRVRTRRTLTVKIPPGVDSGARIQLRGQGEVGPGGGPAADLYVEIREVPDPVFSRNGDDLHCTVNIPMTAAALGMTIDLDTLDGRETIVVKPGTQPGSSHRVRGKGVPHLHSERRGDLIVHLEVEVPTRLTGEQEGLLRQLAVLRGEDKPQASAVESTGLFSRLRDAFSGR